MLWLPMDLPPVKTPVINLLYCPKIKTRMHDINLFLNSIQKQKTKFVIRD